MNFKKYFDVTQISIEGYSPSEKKSILAELSSLDHEFTVYSNVSVSTFSAAPQVVKDEILKSCGIKAHYAVSFRNLHIVADSGPGLLEGFNHEYAHLLDANTGDVSNELRLDPSEREDETTVTVYPGRYDKQEWFADMFGKLRVYGTVTPENSGETEEAIKEFNRVLEILKGRLR